MRTLLLLLAALLVGCPSGSDDDDFANTTEGCSDDPDGDGWCGDDCAPENPAVHPGADELCDGLDTDCSGSVPPAETRDEDLDGAVACADCNDNDGNAFPGNEEVCDGIDNDCSGAPEPDEVDEDNDGQMACVDCKDQDPNVYPGAPEVECDGFDSNCDGVLHVMESDPDHDGWTACEGDCDTQDPTVHPEAEELCDRLDTNCDAVIPYEELDADNDGWMLCDGDCDDEDNDCNGLNDWVGPQSDEDADGDGWAECEGDCDDGDPVVHPGGYDLLDGTDGDCDGAAGVPGYGPVAGSQSDVLAALQSDCLIHGLELASTSFEGGTPGDVAVEAGMNLFTDGDSGAFDVLYADQLDAWTARTGSNFLVPAGPVATFSFLFDQPQTMAAAAVGGYTEGLWADYVTLFLWDGALVAVGPMFADVDPAGGWGFRGWTSLDQVAFDELVLVAGGEDEVFAVDDLYYCAP